MSRPRTNQLARPQGGTLGCAHTHTPSPPPPLPSPPLSTLEERELVTIELRWTLPFPQALTGSGSWSQDEPGGSFSMRPCAEKCKER
ncbi:hypothetical protein JZ751_020757 [Albula glossodonta]|uniref:Uncharacterized protein n=1 Tax=Albula glossodonta TaxID=121402 RepID=A0A8T2PIK0_9TELE|nr:hypothetical protein JZ751_020757 [Albula glossodonta]